jgi:leader peptidase (prepilin peptidase)/N-methyltransferase
VVGVALIALRHGGRKTAVPFGPFMVAGALLGLLVAEPIAQWYANLLTF